MTAFLAAGWGCALLAAPFLPVALSAVVYLAGSVVCHQLADRSYHVGGAQLPVCARCIGVYWGFAAGLLASRLVAAPRWHRGSVLALLTGAVATNLVTVAYESLQQVPTSHALRTAAGAILGLGIAAVVTWAGATLHYGRWPQGPRRHAGTT